MSMWKYDVHLRYPGEDPCKGFIDQLCNAFNQNGIRALREARELKSYTYPIYRVYEKSMFSIIFVNEKKISSQIEDIFAGAVDYKKYMVIVYNSKPSVTEYQTGEALAINEAAYGAEVHDRREALSMVAVTCDGPDDIDTTNGYQSFIDEIIKRISKMIYEESPGRKGFELISFLEKRLAIFWDIKSSPFPTNVNPEDIAKKIIAFVKRETKTNWEAVDVYAYGHSSAEQKAKLHSIGHSLAEQNVKLHNSGVTLIHTPQHGRKDTTYIALLVDMFKRSHNCPPPSSIMLITGEISYANTLQALGLLGHKIIFVTSSKVGDSVPLINASMYTWSDVAKGPTSSSQVQIKELPDDNNNWPGSILVKRDDLVAISSSQFKELSMRYEKFVFHSHLAMDWFYIFWDLENCRIPREVPTKDVVLNIWTFVKGKIGCGFPKIRAYADFSLTHNGEVRESLKKCGVDLINTPHVKKDAADEAMIIDLFMYSKLVSSPSSIMVITGDVDFARTLHAIDGFGHNIFLAVPSGVGVSESLTSAAKGCWSWPEVANKIDLTGLRGQLVNLLKSNGGQLHLGSLDDKADKLVNLLNKMSDVISVEDLNGETLVKLKGD